METTAESRAQELFLTKWSQLPARAAEMMDFVRERRIPMCGDVMHYVFGAYAELEEGLSCAAPKNTAIHWWNNHVLDQDASK